MRLIETSLRPGPRLLRACAGFGLGVTRPSRSAKTDPMARDIVASASAGSILLITGPSGSGKTRLGRSIAHHARDAGVPTIKPSLRRTASRTILDCLPAALDDALAGLSRAGLADAAVLARTPAELSDGELWRLALARAMLRSQRLAKGRSLQPKTPIVLCDEWCSLLDRHTARSVCIAARKWMTRAPMCCLICITAHDDVARWLSPDRVIRLGS